MYKVISIAAFLLYLIILLSSTSTHALVPLKNLILGDLGDKYNSKEADPLNYLFSDEPTLQDDDDLLKKRRRLAIYRGFYKEGENLRNYCKSTRKADYPTRAYKRQVKRSVLATLQYIGIDLTTRAIAKYAKEMSFTLDEFRNLSKNIVYNNCSKNLSIISLNNLEAYLLNIFDNDNSFKLPTIENNSLFSKRVLEHNSHDKSIRQEFTQTVKDFRAFCSWGGDADDMRLLTPLIKNPIIYSFIVRQLTDRRIDWVSEDNQLVLREGKGTKKVLCQNYICRQTSTDIFRDKIPRSIGSTGLSKDLNNLYCSDFLNVKFGATPITPEKVKGWIEGTSRSGEKFLSMQFIALLTGIPDFFVRGGKFNSAKLFLKSAFEDSWRDWSKNQLEKYSEDLYFEESLKIEKVDRSLYFRRIKDNFLVVLDVNRGEFDRSNQIVGKLTLSFNIKLKKKLLCWFRRKLQRYNPADRSLTYTRASLERKLSKYLGPDIERARAKYSLPTWNAGLEKVIGKEILEQVSLYYGTKLSNCDSKEDITIPVYLNYGPFALKYLYEKSESQKK